MIEEAEVIRRVVDGDVEAFCLLVRRYERPVFSAICNIVLDVHCCEDIAQDVFLTAYRQLDRFDSRRSSFSTWLFTIARNKSINALKKKIPTTVGELPPPIWARTPADDLAEKELFSRLDEVLEQLPTAQKTVFVLAELLGLSHEEVAAIEAVSRGTVRSRLSRARKRLRHLLREYAGEDA